MAEQTVRLGVRTTERGTGGPTKLRQRRGGDSARRERGRGEGTGGRNDRQWPSMASVSSLMGKKKWGEREKREGREKKTPTDSSAPLVPGAEGARPFASARAGRGGPTAAV
jgi:hypothetical protein